jgi:anti-anti-sigma factor
VDEYAYFLRGEIDLANADAILADLRARAAVQSGPLVVDCMGLEFIDASGLRAFVIADNELREQERRLLLVNAMPMLARVLRVCGLTDLLIPTNASAAVRVNEVV